MGKPDITDYVRQYCWLSWGNPLLLQPTFAALVGQFNITDLEGQPNLVDLVG